MRRVSIHCGDSLKILQTLPDNSIDSLVTDPPCGISFMGKAWDSDKGGPREWRMWLSKIMEEALRVMKPGAHGLVWAIPRTSHWTGMALENAGFEIRDVITHIFGSGFPKNHNVGMSIDKTLGEERERLDTPSRKNSSPSISKSGYGAEGWKQPSKDPISDEAKQYDGYGTALKPSGEAWWVVRKPFGILDYTLPSSDRLESIKEGLCLFLSDAKIAKKNSKLTKARSKEGSQSIAQELAQTKTKGSKGQKIPIGEGEDSQEKMAMFSFDVKTANIVLSIVSSWLNILKEISKHASTFTTKTGIDLITDLRTSNSLISQTTQDSIAQDVLSQNGSRSVARIVGDLLSACLLKSNAIQSLSVIENAGKIAASQKRTEETQQEEGPEEMAEPSSEMWWLIRKPFDGTIANCVLDHGTGAINIDGTRVGDSGGTEDLKDGVGVRSNIVFGKYGSCKTEGLNKGRWPPNTVFTHSAFCVDGACAKFCPIRELDEQSGMSKGTTGKRGGSSPNPMSWDESRKDGDVLSGHQDEGGASRYFPKFKYQAKPSREEKEAGLKGCAKVSGMEITGRKEGSAGSECSQYAGTTEALRSNVHPTVKPIELMRWLIKLITPKGGTVLDPFMGSGTTGCAAVFEGFGFVGIDLSAEYCEISRKRMEWWSLKASQSIDKKEELGEDGKPVQRGFDFG